jgi:hypothetical protein
VSLFWAAKNAYDAIGMGMWTQGLDAEFDTVLERCRAALGEAAFAEASEGRTCDYDGEQQSNHDRYI